MKKGITKFLAVLLCCCCLFSFTFFSALGYSSIIVAPSSDWTSDFASYEYPDVPNWFTSECYDYTDLYDDTCFYSQEWLDDGYSYKISAYDVTFTLEDIWIIEDAYFYDLNAIVFASDTTVYLLYYNSNNTLLAYDSVSDELYISLIGSTLNSDNFVLYYMNYPYDSWVKYSNASLILTLSALFTASLSIGGDYLISFFSNVDKIIYSDVDLRSYSDGSVYMSASEHTWGATDIATFTMYGYSSIDVVTCSVSLEFTPTQLKSLQTGSLALLLDDYGAIFVTNAGLFYLTSTLSVYGADSDGVYSLLGSMDYLSVTLYDTYDFTSSDSDILSAGSAIILDYVDNFYWYNFYEDYSDFYIVATVTILSDAYFLYFPGTLSLVDYADYEEDIHHDETIDAITSIGNDISSSINSQTQTLVYTLVGSDNDNSVVNVISNNIHNSLVEVFNSDLSAQYVSIDTSEFNNLVDYENAVVADLYTSLESSLDDLGFDLSVYGLDTISNFGSSYAASIRGVSSLFDDIVSAVDISALLMLCLLLGFCVYLLGRRLDKN